LKYWTPRDRPPYHKTVNNRVRYINCVQPPNKEILFNFLQELADEHDINLGIQRDKMPDRVWMVICIGTLKEDHPIFAKNYKPVVRSKQPKFETMFDNDDGFFTGLAPRRNLNDKNQPRFTLISKQQRLDFELHKQEKKMEREAKKMEQLKQKKNELAQPQNKEEGKDDAATRERKMLQQMAMFNERLKAFEQEREAHLLQQQQAQLEL